MMIELFLLGAGASVDAGIPDANSMTKTMVESFAWQDRYEQIYKALQFVVGGLLFQRGIRGEDPYRGVNIEDLFNAIISLGERQNSELRPFISSWHPQLVSLEHGRVTGDSSHHLLRSIYEPIEQYTRELGAEIANGAMRALKGNPFSTLKPREIDDSFSSRRFAEAFVEAVREVVVGGEGDLFKAAADAMISKLVEMVWLTAPSATDYLVPLVDYAHRKRSTIVTLNYDNAIELAGQRAAIEIDTGFDHWSNSQEFDFDPDKVPLLKLHGSIDWALSEGKPSADKPLPFQIIQRVKPEAGKEPNFRPAVVFGGKNKLTARGPFLSLLRAFERKLSKATRLWIIGYSGNDEHVNEFIVNWFNGDPTRAITVINPNASSMNPLYYRHLINGIGRPRVDLMWETAAKGIAKLTTTK